MTENQSGKFWNYEQKKISADFEIGIYDSLTEDLKFHFGQSLLVVSYGIVCSPQ